MTRPKQQPKRKPGTFHDLTTLERWTPTDKVRLGKRQRVILSAEHRLCVLPDGSLHVFMHQSGKGKDRQFVSCLFIDKHLPHFSLPTPSRRKA